MTIVLLKQNSNLRIPTADSSTPLSLPLSHALLGQTVWRGYPASFTGTGNAVGSGWALLAHGTGTGDSSDWSSTSFFSTGGDPGDVCVFLMTWRQGYHCRFLFTITFLHADITHSPQHHTQGLTSHTDRLPRQ